MGTSRPEGSCLPLSANDATLLSVIIGATATFWAIGFAVYFFIFEYLDRWVERELNRRPLGRQELAWAIGRLGPYRCVFIGFMVAGFLSFATVLVAGVGYAVNSHEWVVPAGIMFLVTLVAYLVLFTHELLTSIRYVPDRTKLLEKPSEPRD